MRGIQALHHSYLPLLSRAMLRQIQCWAIPGQGTVWDLSYTGWRLSGDLPMRQTGTLSLAVTLQNEQRIEVFEAGV